MEWISASSSSFFLRRRPRAARPAASKPAITVSKPLVSAPVEARVPAEVPDDASSEPLPEPEPVVEPSDEEPAVSATSSTVLPEPP